MHVNDENDWVIRPGVTPGQFTTLMADIDLQLLDEIRRVVLEMRSRKEMPKSAVLELLRLISKAASEGIPADALEEATGILNRRIYALMAGNVTAEDFMNGNF